jgi:ABC-2 type transport system ATP-binding protein
MIECSNIRKQFGKTIAVDGLSLSIHQGEVFGLLGPNGAGKTTTISMATGLLKPDSGTIRIEHEGHWNSPTELAIRRWIGISPQTVALYETLSARENLTFFAATYGLHGTAARTSVDDALVKVGLLDRAHDHVNTYSGGMKRRLNLAAAILHSPKIVFMDEPTAGVDPQSRNAILEIVADLRRQGVTIVYSTHYMEEAERVCDRVGIVDHGKVLAVGTVQDLLAAHGGHSTVEIVRTIEGQRAERIERVERVETSDPVATLRESLATPGVRSARVQSPNLESVFLSLTGRSLRD